MQSLRQLLDRIFGERVPEGVDAKFWRSRHARIHNRPFHTHDCAEWHIAGLCKRRGYCLCQCGQPFDVKSRCQDPFCQVCEQRPPVPGR